MEMGRNEEAISEARRALELDPLSLIIGAQMGDALAHAGRTDEGIEQLKKTTQMDPNFPEAHWTLAEAFAQKKMYSEAVSEWQTAMKLSAYEPGAMALIEAYKASGYQGFLQKWIDQLLQRPAGKQLPYELARLYARLGKKEGLKWLEKAYAEHVGAMLFLKCEPAFDSWRSDPRFQSLMRRMNFPE
jgi:tetratricopeptide (TPR) repeat protein